MGQVGAPGTRLCPVCCARDRRVSRPLCPLQTPATEQHVRDALDGRLCMQR